MIILGNENGLLLWIGVKDNWQQNNSKFKSTSFPLSSLFLPR